MQPDESQIDGDKQVMISGDVQNPQFVQTGMQPQTVIIDPNTGMPQNVIIMQQPSSAPKVIGILVIIYSGILTLLTAIGILGLSLLMDPDSSDYISEYADNSTVLYLTMLISLGLLIAQIVGGSFIIQKKTQGIYIVWICLAITAIINVIVELRYPEITEAGGGFSTSIAIGQTLVCGGICGLLVAIPLMISDSGMDNSMKIL